MRLRIRTQLHTSANSRITPVPAATAAEGAGTLLRAAVRAASTGKAPMTASAGGQPVRNARRMPATSGGSRLQPSPPALGAPAMTLTTAPATAPSAAGTTHAAAIANAGVDGPAS